MTTTDLYVPEPDEELWFEDWADANDPAVLAARTWPGVEVAAGHERGHGDCSTVAFRPEVAFAIATAQNAFRAVELAEGTAVNEAYRFDPENPGSLEWSEAGDASDCDPELWGTWNSEWYPVNRDAAGRYVLGTVHVWRRLTEVTDREATS